MNLFALVRFRYPTLILALPLFLASSLALSLPCDCFATEMSLSSDRVDQFLKIRIEDAPASLACGSIQIEVYNIIGRLLMSEVVTLQAEFDLDLKALSAAGIYFVRVHLGEEMFVRKFIKN